jgi:hypothetical protein
MLAFKLPASVGLPTAARVIGTLLKAPIAVLWSPNSLVRRAKQLWPVSAWNLGRQLWTKVGLCKRLKTLALG